MVPPASQEPATTRPSRAARRIARSSPAGWPETSNTRSAPPPSSDRTASSAPSGGTDAGAPKARESSRRSPRGSTVTSPPRGEAGEQGGEGKTQDPLPHHRHPVADARGPVEEQVHRGFQIGEQRGAFVGEPPGNPEQLGGRGAEHALVRHEAEDALPGPEPGARRRAGGGRRPDPVHHPHRGVAVLEGIAEPALPERPEGLVPRPPRIEPAAEGGAFGPGADRRDRGAHPRLPRPRFRQRRPAHPDAAGRLEPEREALPLRFGHRESAGVPGEVADKVCRTGRPSDPRLGGATGRRSGGGRRTPGRPRSAPRRARRVPPGPPPAPAPVRRRRGGAPR